MDVCNFEYFRLRVFEASSVIVQDKQAYVFIVKNGKYTNVISKHFSKLQKKVIYRNEQT
jgi:hypothetical protein